MPYHQALSIQKSNLDTNSLNQASCVRSKVAKLLNKPLMKVSLTASIAITTIYQPTSNQAVYAIDLNKQESINSSSLLTPTSTTTKTSEPNYPAFLPRILSVITSHFRNISAINPVHSPTKNIIPYQSSATSQHNLNLSHGSSYPQPNLDLATNTQIESSQPSSPTESQIQPQLKIYNVQPGDTLHRIAAKYQVSREELIKINNLKNSNVIQVNQQLKIPITNPPVIAQVSETQINSFDGLNKSAKENSSSHTAKNPYIAKLKAEIEQMRVQYGDREEDIASNPSNNNDQPINPAPVNDSPYNNLDPNSLQAETIALKLPPLPPSEEYLPNAFDGYIWPAQGALTSGYGYRWGRLHAGIDIAAPVGTPIFAAASGEVIEAGWNSGGYGNLVKLQHLDGSVTLYAHNERILVSLGQQVDQGEQISEMGSTGFSTGSHLHFEIHPLGQAAVNPIAYLSK
ncbi:peptidase M23 [Chondrocystis sp. NIES-4102]|nr:peptidase M23 [Chondrocystis sp. NIES-4102]